MFEADQLVNPVIVLLELGGFSVITLGMLGVTVRVLYDRLVNRIDWEETYVRIRRGNGRSLVLGLEILVAAEIIRSITAETLQAVLLLAAVVVIRTFLAITVEMETEGHWPWERRERRKDDELDDDNAAA